LTNKSQIEIKPLYKNVAGVSFKNVRAGWEQWILLTSDQHFDSIHCDRALMKKHLDKAKQRNALIFSFGDFFDAMNGRYDPRRNYADMRPEYFKAPSYLQAIVEDAAEFIKPYAGQVVVIGRGNHDQSVRKNNDYDIVSGLVTSINAGLAIRRIDHRVQVGGYGGWVKFRFLVQTTRSLSKDLYYHHGAGGGGPVTRGTIQSNRQAVYLPDADIVVNGHTHDSWHLPIRRSRLTQAGVPVLDYQHHIRVPSYKEDYGDGAEGWHVETWKPPKPIGCVWLRFFYDNKEVELEVIQDMGN
jgi:predicted phosphodiesterase